MVPPLPDTLPNDTEFDLDVRLQPVARHLSTEPVNRLATPPEAGCPAPEPGGPKPCPDPVTTG